MAKKGRCPRCQGQMLDWDEGDRLCLQCGHVIHCGSIWSRLPGVGQERKLSDLDSAAPREPRAKRR